MSNLERAGRSFGERFVGALKLDGNVFEEIEHDETALPQAAGVVALGAVAAALGGASAGAQGVLGGVFSAFIGWAVGAGIIWAIGVRWMGHTSDYPELLRTIGFASAPAVLLAIGVLPLGPLVVLVHIVAGVLMLIAYVIAVRQALDVETGAAIVVCFLALLVRWVLDAIF